MAFKNLNTKNQNFPSFRYLILVLDLPGWISNITRQEKGALSIMSN